MSKKLCAVFVVMLCLTAVFPVLSMSTGSAGAQNNRTNNSAELKVNAWVENKIAKSGDLVEVYATTSYNDGVSVSAKIVKYNLETLYGITIPLPTTIGTISLTYNALGARWEGQYQIPGNLHGLYGTEVTATDGTKSATDSPVGEMMNFYLEHLSPVIQDWETFKQNQLEPTIEYINQSIHNLSTTVEDHGGLKGIVKNITSLPEWTLFLGACYKNTSTAQMARFLDALTNFILSSEYDQLILLKPEMRALFENIFQLMLTGKPLQVINYLAEFNFTTFLDKIAGSENIISAYQALISASEYTNFFNALDALRAALTKENFENVASALQQLGESNCVQELLNVVAQYSQGDQTLLQQLIQNLSAFEDTDFEAQLSNLTNLTDFWNLIYAMTQDPNLGVVFNCINTTFYDINTTVHQMANSTEFQALNQSIQSISEYMSSDAVEMKGFSHDSYGIRYYEQNFTVRDWMEELEMEINVNLGWSGGYEEVPEETGQVDVTLTDPNGVEYLYTYDESVWGQRETICYPTPGDWTINVTASFSDNGDFSLKIAPKQDFPAYMLLGIIDELFFVLNAGIAIETESFAQIGTNATATLIAYDVDGRLANAEVNVLVNRLILGGSTITPPNLYAEYGGGSQMTEPIFSIFQLTSLLTDVLPKTVYEATVTTNADGEVAISFPIEEYGFYSIFAYIKTDTKLGFGATEIFSEQYVPEIALQKLGEFSGIPVYKSPNKIGENITLEVQVPEGAQTAAVVQPIPFGERYPEIDVTYNQASNFTNVSGNLTLQVNGPVSIIAIVSGNLAAMQPEEKPPEYPSPYLYVSAYPGDEDYDGEYNDVCIYVYDQYGAPVVGASVYIDGILCGVTDADGVFYGYDYSIGTYSADVWYGDITASTTFEIYGTRGVDVSSSVMQGVPSVPQLPTIPQINVSYGILLTSDVDVSLTIPTLVKGGTSTICLSAQGTIGNTSGLAFYSNGTDFTAFDLGLFSKLFYRYSILGKEPSSPTEPLELLSGTTGIVWGSDTTANVKLPTLCAYGDYSIITVSAVDSQFGVGFAQASFYKNLTVAKPIVTTNDSTIKYYVCTAPINRRYVTSSEFSASQKTPPAGKKMVGTGLELNTTGTFGEAFITLSYTDDEIAGIDENSLKMYYWNEITNEWTLIPDSGVWTNNNTVWARVTHLTIFAPMAEEVAAAPSLLSPIYLGVIAAIIAVLIISVAVVARKRKKVT